MSYNYSNFWALQRYLSVIVLAANDLFFLYYKLLTPTNLFFSDGVQIMENLDLYLSGMECK